MKFLQEIISRKARRPVEVAARARDDDRYAAAQNDDVLEDDAWDDDADQDDGQDDGDSWLDDDTDPAGDLQDDIDLLDLPDAGARLFSRPETPRQAAGPDRRNAAPDKRAPAAAEGADADADENEDEDVINIWDMFEDDAKADLAEAPEVPETPDAPEKTDQELAREALNIAGVRRPVAAAPEAANSGRVKTRLLGFHGPEVAEPNVFERNVSTPAPALERFPVGWLVVIEGPGRGTSFTLYNGVSKIGRGTDQTICLAFGDTAISRDNHAAIAYDDDQNLFYVGHGGKSNLVRLNGHPVLSTEPLANADLIRVGETSLRFVAFCSPEFAWDLTDEHEFGHARAG